jgi:hypothetical protein
MRSYRVRQRRNSGIIAAAGSATASRPFLQWCFPVAMRAAPTAFGWSPATGTVLNVRNLNTNADVAYTVFATDETNFTVTPERDANRGSCVHGSDGGKREVAVMAEYALVVPPFDGVLRAADGAAIPNDANNVDWQA